MSLWKIRGIVEQILGDRYKDKVWQNDNGGYNMRIEIEEPRIIIHYTSSWDGISYFMRCEFSEGVMWGWPYSIAMFEEMLRKCVHIYKYSRSEERHEAERNLAKKHYMGEREGLSKRYINEEFIEEELKRRGFELRPFSTEYNRNGIMIKVRYYDAPYEASIKIGEDKRATCIGVKTLSPILLLKSIDLFLT